MSPQRHADAIIDASRMCCRRSAGSALPDASVQIAGPHFRVASLPVSSCCAASWYRDVLARDRELGLLLIERHIRATTENGIKYGTSLRRADFLGRWAAEWQRRRGLLCAVAGKASHGSMGD